MNLCSNKILISNFNFHKIRTNLGSEPTLIINQWNQSFHLSFIGDITLYQRVYGKLVIATCLGECRTHDICLVMVMVFNTTFNNISVILWQIFVWKSPIFTQKNTKKGISGTPDFLVFDLFKFYFAGIHLYICNSFYIKACFAKQLNEKKYWKTIGFIL